MADAAASPIKEISFALSPVNATCPVESKNSVSIYVLHRLYRRLSHCGPSGLYLLLLWRGQFVATTPIVVLPEKP